MHCVNKLKLAMQYHIPFQFHISTKYVMFIYTWRLLHSQFQSQRLQNPFAFLCPAVMLHSNIAVHMKCLNVTYSSIPGSKLLKLKQLIITTSVH